MPCTSQDFRLFSYLGNPSWSHRNPRLWLHAAAQRLQVATAEAICRCSSSAPGRVHGVRMSATCCFEQGALCQWIVQREDRKTRKPKDEKGGSRTRDQGESPFVAAEPYVSWMRWPCRRSEFLCRFSSLATWLGVWWSGWRRFSLLPPL